MMARETRCPPLPPWGGMATGISQVLGPLSVETRARRALGGQRGGEWGQVAVSRSHRGADTPI